MTRYLCAAVTMNQKLTQMVIDDILEEPYRAIAVTPGMDLVTVLKYALSANRRRVIRDIVLFFILILLVICVVSILGIILVIPLLFTAWLAVFIERYTTFFGTVARGLRPAFFDASKAPSPARGSFDDKQLTRVAAASEVGNVTLYSGFPPFVGYGTVNSSWSFVVDLTAGGSGRSPRPFMAQEIYDHVRSGLGELDLANLKVTDRVFVNGRDIVDDARFLPDPRGAPVTDVSDEVVRSLMERPSEHARPYLTVSATGWQGDIVVTTFIRFLLSRTNLFVEAAHTVVPPLRDEFRAIDEMDQNPTFGEFFRIVFESGKSTFPRLLGSPISIFHGMGAGGRREKKRRRMSQAADYGALISLREAAADTKWHRYFQKFDDARYSKIVEDRILRSLLEFLKDHNVDTSKLEERTATLINNGIINESGATMNAQQIAGGPNAEAGGFFDRLRGKESSAGTEGARS